MYVGQKTKPRASFTRRQYADGTVYVQTTVRWGRNTGRYMTHQNRTGTIDNPSRFKSWCKKYSIFDESAKRVWQEMKNARLYAYGSPFEPEESEE